MVKTTWKFYMMGRSTLLYILHPDEFFRDMFSKSSESQLQNPAWVVYFLKQNLCHLTHDLHNNYWYLVPVHKAESIHTTQYEDLENRTWIKQADEHTFTTRQRYKIKFLKMGYMNWYTVIIKAKMSS